MRISACSFIYLTLLLGCEVNHNNTCKEDRKTKDSSTINHSQKDITGLYNSWMFNDLNMDDTLTLLRLDSIKHKGAKVLTFNNNKSLTFWLYQPIPSCGNGRFSLNDSISYWEFNKTKNKIILSLQGGYNLDYDFKRMVEYIIDSSQVNKLILIKSKIYYNKTRRFGELNYI